MNWIHTAKIIVLLIALYKLATTFSDLLKTPRHLIDDEPEDNVQLEELDLTKEDYEFVEKLTKEKKDEN